MKTKLFGFKAFAIFATLLSVIGFTSCNDKGNTDDTLPTLNIISPETGQTDNNLSLSAGKDGVTLSFAVESNRSWTVSSDASWAKVTTASGKNNGMVSIEIEPNDGGMRVANITVTSSTLVRKVAITQSGSGSTGEGMTIAQFREKYYEMAESSTTKDNKENPYIELTEQVVLNGTVISDNDGGNVQNFLLMMQDATTPNSGICISTKANHGFVMGDKVMVTCETGRKVKIYNGLLQLEATTVQKTGTGTVEAVEIAISDISKYESQLITLSGVQTKTEDYEKWNGGQGSNSYNGVTFENEEGETVIAYVKAGSKLAGEKPSTGNGKLTGIASCYYETMQIQPRNAEDVAALTGARFTKEAPVNGKNILLKETFGATEVSSNTNVDKFTGWSKEGLGAENVAYSAPFEYVSVRKTGTSNGAYEGASGGNNAFFGNYEGGPTLIVSNINLGGAKNIKIGLGSNNTDEKLAISYSVDNGATWQELTYTKKSTAWDYMIIPVTLTQTAAEMSVKFVAVSGAQVRIDDVTVSTDDDVTVVEITKPEVTTKTPVASYTSIECSGSYTYEGAAADITEVGFYLDGTKTAAELAANFVYSWTGLQEATQHTVQAYVVCKDIIYKGEEASVATLSQQPAEVMTVSQLVAAWKEAEMGAAVGLNKQVKGVVTFRAENSNENFAYSVMILSDNNGEKNSAIMFYGTAEDALIKNAGIKEGDMIILSLDNATFGTNNGVRQIQGVKSTDLVQTVSSGNEAVVKTVTIADVLTGDYQGVSIAVQNVEPETAGKVSSNPKFTDGTSSIATYTRSAWTYASKSYAKVKGTLKGVGNIYKETIQITPLKVSDIADFTVPELKVSDVLLGVEASSTATLSISTDEGAAWTAAVTGAGFTLSATSGTGPAEITVTASAAGGSEVKLLGTVDVTLTETPSITATATIKQKAQSTGSAITVWEDSFNGLESSGNVISELKGSTTGFTGSYSGLQTIYPGTNCIKIGKASGGGSITTPALNLIPAGETKTLTITFYADGWNKKNCVLTVTANNAGTASEAQTIKSETTASGTTPTLSKNNQYTFTVTGATSATTLTFATGNTAAMFGDLLVVAE